MPFLFFYFIFPPFFPPPRTDFLRLFVLVYLIYNTTHVHTRGVCNRTCTGKRSLYTTLYCRYDYYDTAESRWLVKKYDSTATKRIRDARRDNWVQDKLLAESSCSNGSDRSGTRAHSPRSIHEIMRRPAFTLADLHAECEKRSQFWKRSGPLFPGFVTVVKFMVRK